MLPMRTHGNPFQSAFRGWTKEAWTYCLSGCQSRNGSPPLGISTSFPAHKAGLNPCGTRCEAKGWSFDFHAEPLIPWRTPHFPIIWQKVYPAAWCYCKRIVSFRQGYGRPARKAVRRIRLIFIFIKYSLQKKLGHPFRQSYPLFFVCSYLYSSWLTC